MFGLRKKRRQGAALEIKQLILVQKTRYALMQNKAKKEDFDTFSFYQSKITALSDLQQEIEEKFQLIQ